MGHEIKISIITPSIRPNALEMVYKSLQRQTFKDFEWIVIGNDEVGKLNMPFAFVKEPPKKDGDYYSLNKAYNAGFSRARGSLLVSLQDGIWLPPDTLNNFWEHYKANPNACVGAIGHQYDRIENGKPEHMVWKDPRHRTDFGSFYEIRPIDIEFTLCSIPRSAVLRVGGIDEVFDKYAALSEKEMCIRIDRLDYTFWLDQTIEYRAVKHPRLTSDWDVKYNEGQAYFSECIHNVISGQRLSLDYL